MVSVSGSASSSAIRSKAGLSLKCVIGRCVRGLAITTPGINHVRRAAADLILLVIKPGTGSVLGCIIAKCTGHGHSHSLTVAQVR